MLSGSRLMSSLACSQMSGWTVEDDFLELYLLGDCHMCALHCAAQIALSATGASSWVVRSSTPEPHLCSEFVSHLLVELQAARQGTEIQL